MRKMVYCCMCVNVTIVDSCLQGITIQSREALERARQAGLVTREPEDGLPALVLAPGGYPFYLIDQPQPTDR